jgi:hypothetical protein
MAHAVALFAVLGSGIGAAVVGVGPSTVVLAGPQALRLIREAPAALSSFPALNLAFEFKVSGNGQSATIHESAVSTPDGRTGTFTMELPNNGGRLSAKTVGGTLYARAPTGHFPATEGKHWLALKLTRGGEQGGLQAPTGSDALGYLRLLPGATGEVRDYGTEDIDGVQTRHYQVTINLLRVLGRIPPELRTGSVAALRAAGLTTVPYDVWLDGDNAARRVAAQFSLQGVDLAMQIDITGSDRAVHVDAPPNADTYTVTDISEFTRMALGGCC